jgi:UDP-N-acetyl-D-mannosaminouronate:lipid I N-acetyl-D-mannosaminouronosyltransferase
MESKLLNGIRCFAPSSRKELIDYAFSKKVILVAVNAEKILKSTDETKTIINRNVGYPDGIGAVWALQKKGIPEVVKIPGCELWLDIIRQHQSDKTFYLVGAKEEVIQEAQEEVAKTESDDELKQKQDAYKERQRKKREELEARQKELSQQADIAQSNSKQEDEVNKMLAEVLAFKKTQEQEVMIKQAERELQSYEKEYTEAFPDYEDSVKKAIELTKLRLVAEGMDEADAIQYLNREKVLLADRAVAAGLDPVEAIHKEAKTILSTFEQFAELNGYVKAESKEKPKTNLQALREASKPNAMTGGKPASAVKHNFDEEDDMDVIKGATLSDLMKQYT